MRLKEPHLADSLRAHPAGSEVRDTSVLKLQPNVRNVHLPRQHRQAHGAHLAHRLANQLHHNVQIVDHQIQHHVDVQRSRRKHAQPVYLKKHRPVEQLAQCQHGWIEPLQMPHLHHAPTLPRRPDNLVRLCETRRQRLLDQQIDAARHQLLRTRRMMHRGHTHTRGVNPPKMIGCPIHGGLIAMSGMQAARLHALPNRRERAHAILSLRSGSRSLIWIDHRRQLNRIARPLQLAIHPQMVAPERPRAHHRHPQRRAGFDHRSAHRRPSRALESRTSNLEPCPTYFTGISTACLHRAYNASSSVTWSSGLADGDTPNPVPPAAFVPTCVVAATNFSKSSAMSSVRRAALFPSLISKTPLVPDPMLTVSTAAKQFRADASAAFPGEMI